MKKLVLLFAVALCFNTALLSCTPEATIDENETANLIDPEEECPEWDRCNCNGVPDDEEQACQ